MSNKRKRDDCWKLLEFTSEENTEYDKNRKKFKTDRKWVYASAIKAYMLNDPCWDYLKYSNASKCSTYQSNNALIKVGKDAEKYFFDDLKRIHRGHFVVLCNDEDIFLCRKDTTMTGYARKKYNETIELMKQGIDIIGQAFMINDNNFTCGFADLLVRSDYLKNIFAEYFQEDAEIYVKAPLLNLPGSKGYHYRVIDLKWTTVELCTDGQTIRKKGFFHAYKGQLAIYTSCLQQMQGYTPAYSYIMGKAWKIGTTITDNDNYKGTSCYDRPGIIYFNGKDKYVLPTAKEGIMWLRRLHTEGKKWTFGRTKPSVVEMYPNMKNCKIEPELSKQRLQIAEKYRELTLVCYIGTLQRNIAHKKGIFSYCDPRCTAENLEIRGKKGTIVDAILSVNRKNSKDIILPRKIANNDKNWQIKQMNDYYVDFETLSAGIHFQIDEYDFDDSYHGDSTTFMIGLGFEHNDSIKPTTIILEALNIDKNKCFYHCELNKTTKWEYVCMYMCNEGNEIELFRMFYEFLYIRNNWLQLTTSRLYHWSPAEINFLKKAKQKFSIGSHIYNLSKEFDKIAIWVDVWSIFKAEPIVVNKALDFKLKSIARAFHFHKFIKTVWPNNNESLSDGFSAMIKARKIYDSGSAYDDNDLKKIISYNEIDCKVMWEIIEYLRTNHI